MKLGSWTKGLLLFLASCSYVSAAEETVQRSGYCVVGDSSIRADLNQIAELTETAIKSLIDAYPDWKVREAVASAKFQVIVHRKPTEMAGEGLATLLTGSTDYAGKRRYARLHLLAPSSHSATAQTSSGAPMDEQYFLRTLIHEVSSVVVERVTIEKPTGWHWHSVPSWFGQGLGTYVSLRQTESTENLRRILVRVRREGIVQTDFGLQVSEPYLGGTALLNFMEERYGWETILKVVTSPKPTWASAMRSQLGVTADAVTTDFQQWLSSK